MIEQILARAAAAAQSAEVLEFEHEYTPVQFENNKLKSASTRSTKGYALRIIKDGKIGFSSTTRQDAAGLVEAALETARFGQEAVYELPVQPASPQVHVYDAAVADLTVEKMVETGQEALDAVRKAEPDAQVAMSVDRSVTSRRLLNTCGLDVAWQSTYYGLSTGIEIIRGTDMLQVWEGRDSRGLISASDLISALIYKARLGRNIVSLDTRTMPVIFTPKGFDSALIAPMEIAFNGKEVLQGATPVSDKMDQQAVDARISLYDDGTVDLSPGSRPFDDEGLAVGRMPLIEKGVIRNFIYDLESAAKAGRRPTGNGQRGLGSLPSPGYNGLVFEPGDARFEDMIKGVKYGLLIDQTMGAWAGNLRSGEVSGNVHFGLKIENGELVGRVKDVIITCNVFDALRNIEAVENVSHRLSGGLSVPHILFSGLSIATQQ